MFVVGLCVMSLQKGNKQKLGAFPLFLLSFSFLLFGNFQESLFVGGVGEGKVGETTMKVSAWKKGSAIRSSFSPGGCFTSHQSNGRNGIS